MAVDLERFLADQLQALPADHPDRAFLTAQHALVTAFVERTPTADGDAAPGGPPTPPETELYNAGDVVEPVVVADLAQAEHEERQRVVLRGRMGQRVRFTNTRNGVRKAEFNLAVAMDEETADWHTVLAFRGVAEKLEQAAPRKGQYVEVIGYQQTEERTDKAGHPKQVERVIAAHIRLR